MLQKTKLLTWKIYLKMDDNFLEQIRAVILERKISNNALSKLTGLDIAFCSRFMSKKNDNPKWEAISKMLAGLKIKPVLKK